MSNTIRHWGPLGPCEPVRVVETGERTGVQREHETTGATACASCAEQIAETTRICDFHRDIAREATDSADAAETENTRLTAENIQLRAALAKVRSMTGYLPGVDPALLSDDVSVATPLGPEALVERIAREMRFATLNITHGQAINAALIGWAEQLDALASASPAPARVSCADKRTWTYTEENEELLCRALQAEALQQSQAQEIATMREALTKIAESKVPRHHTCEYVAWMALKGQKT
jgi:type II secretory pathway component GspD/PulD (secretin)